MSTLTRIVFLSLMLSPIFNATGQQVDSRKLINLGPNINSASLEINPRVSGDGKTLYFTREQQENDYKFQEIWVAEKDTNGQWQPSRRLEKPLNTEQSNSVVSVSEDGTKLMIKGFYKNGKVRRNGFSFVRLDKEGWNIPQGIVIDGYSKLDKGQYNNACISNDYKVLVFSFSTQRKVLDNDLYISFRKEDETYTQPVKLGDNINVKGHMEFASFLADDNKTLYFTSDKPGSFGATDIYKTERLDDTWLKWSDPVNLGDKINGAGRDGYYTLDASGTIAYMVSDQNAIGLADIVMVELEQKPKPKPDPMVYVKGNIFDAKTNKAIDAFIEYNKIPSDTTKHEIHADPESGKYSITLPYNDKYLVRVHQHGYMSTFDTLFIKKKGEFITLVKNFYITPIIKGEKVVLKHVNFETNSAILQTDSYDELDKVVSFLAENPHVTIRIGGHTDNAGSPEENKILSDKRANSVMAYLLSKGIDPGRLEAKGYGQDEPIASNDEEDGRGLNRRVEFTITQE